MISGEEDKMIFHVKRERRKGVQIIEILGTQ
jgi:hypothetical protein